jgi:K+-transporting ATPase KdpF subunit
MPPATDLAATSKAVVSKRRNTCHGFNDLDTGDDGPRANHAGFDVCIPRCVRARVKDFIMIVLTVGATIFLFIYLMAALLRPEWF